MGDELPAKGEPGYWLCSAIRYLERAEKAEARVAELEGAARRKDNVEGWAETALTFYELDDGGNVGSWKETELQMSLGAPLSRARQRRGGVMSTIKEPLQVRLMAGELLIAETSDAELWLECFARIQKLAPPDLVQPPDRNATDEQK